MLIENKSSPTNNCKRRKRSRKKKQEKPEILLVSKTNKKKEHLTESSNVCLGFAIWLLDLLLSRIWSTVFPLECYASVTKMCRTKGRVEQGGRTFPCLMKLEICFFKLRSVSLISERCKLRLLSCTCCASTAKTSVSCVIEKRTDRQTDRTDCDRKSK